MKAVHTNLWQVQRSWTSEVTMARGHSSQKARNPDIKPFPATRRAAIAFQKGASEVAGHNCI
jgi:hypothetical protein